MRQPTPDRRHSRRIALRAALLLPVLFAASPAFAGAFGPAETLTYDCRYLGLTVGKLELIVGAATRMSGRDIWPVMALAKTEPLFVLYPVQDRFVTWWDPERQVTLGSEFLVNEQNKRRRERVRYARDESRAQTIRERPEGRDEATYDVPGDAQDVLSAILAVRGRRLDVGDRVELPVFTGRKTFTLKIHVEGKEPLEVAAGKFDTKVLQVEAQFSGGLASKRAIRIYVTDDARQIPVRADAEFLFGSLVADLTSYQKGLTP